MSTPKPILVGREQVEFEATCDQCVHEKNAPHESGRSWGQGEDHSDVTVRGERRARRRLNRPLSDV